MAASNESLATAFQRCKQSFNAVLIILTELGSSSTAAWEDEASRLRLWGANIGAAQSKANTSLDFRLRDADTVRLQIHKNLSNLDEALHEALECIGELTRPLASDRDAKHLEESAPSQTSSTSSTQRESTPVRSQEQDANCLSENEGSAEDLQAAFDDVVSLINSLFRMTLYIRNPSRRDQLKHRDTSAVANFEAFDVSHVENKFPKAVGSLTQRLGQANTVRRANLRYWERHHKKLAYDESVNDAATIAPLSESVATAFQPPQVEEEQRDTRSHFSGTSYMESMLGGESIRRPDLPELGRSGAPFQCPICCYIVSVSDQREWMKHVFFDLQPYVCVFESCKTPLLLYENRRDWFAHVTNSHLSRTVDDAPFQQIQCPLCHDSVRSFPLIRRHLARHLEEVALFSLPTSLFGEETEVVDDDEQVVYSSDEEASIAASGKWPSDRHDRVADEDEYGEDEKEEEEYGVERFAFETAVPSIRPPREDELSVMRTFARHASHCKACSNPYLALRSGGELCDRGNAYARDVAQYIYISGGRPHSLIDREARSERNEIEIPVDCEVIRNLTKAFHRGLTLRSNPREEPPSFSRRNNFAESFNSSILTEEATQLPPGKSIVEGESGEEDRPYPRKGKTSMPQGGVHTQALRDLGYEFYEEDPQTLVIQKALGPENIDEVFELSGRYFLREGKGLPASLTDFVQSPARRNRSKEHDADSDAEMQPFDPPRPEVGPEETKSMHPLTGSTNSSPGGEAGRITASTGDSLNEAQLMQEIISEGVLDGIDVDRLTEAQQDELSDIIAERYRQLHPRAEQRPASGGTTPTRADNITAPTEPASASALKSDETAPAFSVPKPELIVPGKKSAAILIKNAAGEVVFFDKPVSTTRDTFRKPRQNTPTGDLSHEAREQLRNSNTTFKQFDEPDSVPSRPLTLAVDRKLRRQKSDSADNVFYPDARPSRYGRADERRTGAKTSSSHGSDDMTQRLILDPTESSGFRPTGEGDDDMVCADGRLLDDGRANAGISTMTRASSHRDEEDPNDDRALDDLASELDALRSQWESTSRNNDRLSNQYDLERSPTRETGGQELSDNQAGKRVSIAHVSDTTTQPLVLDPNKLSALRPVGGDNDDIVRDSLLDDPFQQSNIFDQTGKPMDPQGPSELLNAGLPPEIPYDRPISAGLDEKEEKRETRKELEDRLFEIKVREKFKLAGYSDAHIDEVLHRKKREYSTSDREWAIDLSRPTFIRVNHRFLSPETLDHFQLRWEWDKNNDQYIIIKKHIDVEYLDVLFAHTKKLQERGPLTSGYQEDATVTLRPADRTVKSIDQTYLDRTRSESSGADEPHNQRPNSLESRIEHSSLPMRAHSRARILPEAEWERVRPIILQLYVDEERQLEDVRRILSRHHDFDATVQMYKKRFAHWKVDYTVRSDEHVHDGYPGDSTEAILRDEHRGRDERLRDPYKPIEVGASRSRSRRRYSNGGRSTSGASPPGHLPAPPTQWTGQEDSMRRRLNLKAEDDHEKQEEEKMKRAHREDSKRALYHLDEAAELSRR